MAASGGAIPGASWPARRNMAVRRGDIAATGADLIDRCTGRFAVRDFFADTAIYRNSQSPPSNGHRTPPSMALARAGRRPASRCSPM